MGLWSTGPTKMSLYLCLELCTQLARSCLKCVALELYELVLAYPLEVIAVLLPILLHHQRQRSVNELPLFIVSFDHVLADWLPGP
jgi:hypothetical protein